MAVANERAMSEAQIRNLMNDWVEAARAKDASRFIANHDPDVRLFDVVNPLQYAGIDAMKDRMQEWFSSFQGPIGYELRDLQIAADQEVAFCSSLNHVSGTKLDGTKLDMWWRATVCFRKRTGKWMVMHAHNSVPFDVTSGKASLDLKP